MTTWNATAQTTSMFDLQTIRAMNANPLAYFPDEFSEDSEQDNVAREINMIRVEVSNGTIIIAPQDTIKVTTTE